MARIASHRGLLRRGGRVISPSERVESPVPGGRPVVFGEVLWDVFPDGASVLGGAAFNVAWDLHGLGRAPLFISRVGDDELGARVLESLRGFGLETRGVQIDTRLPTGRVTVSLADGQPSYEILDGQAYDAIDAEDAVAALSGVEVALVYHGTLAIRDERSREALDRLVAATAAPRFVDVNLRSPWWSRESAVACLRGARFAKVNDEEVLLLTGASAAELFPAAERLRRESGIQTLILTRGAAGATWFDDDGVVSQAAGRVEALLDTVGAGDAFAAASIDALLAGRPVAETLERAATVAARICGLRGATTPDRAFYAELRAI